MIQETNDAGLFERMRRMQARFDALADRLAEEFADVPQDEGIAEIDAAVRAERRGGVRGPAGSYRPKSAKAKDAKPRAHRK